MLPWLFVSGGSHETWPDRATLAFLPLESISGSPASRTWGAVVELGGDYRQAGEEGCRGAGISPLPRSRRGCTGLQGVRTWISSMFHVKHRVSSVTLRVRRHFSPLRSTKEIIGDCFT